MLRLGGEDGKTRAGCGLQEQHRERPRSLDTGDRKRAVEQKLADAKQPSRVDSKDSVQTSTVYERITGVEGGKRGPIAAGGSTQNNGEASSGGSSQRRNRSHLHRDRAVCPHSQKLQADENKVQTRKTRPITQARGVRYLCCGAPEYAGWTHEN